MVKTQQSVFRKTTSGFKNHHLIGCHELLCQRIVRSLEEDLTITDVAFIHCRCRTPLAAMDLRLCVQNGVACPYMQLRHLPLDDSVQPGLGRRSSLVCQTRTPLLRQLTPVS
jgi:hypothetical protein